MDEEMIGYLDRRFDESERRMRQILEEIVGDTSRQIGGLRQEIGGLRQEIGGLRQETGERFDALRQETGERFDALRQETAERFENVDGQIRHTHVLIEDLRSDLKTVAEGVVNVNEKLDRHIERMDRQRVEDRAADRVVFSHHQESLDDHEMRLSGLESARA
jgi:regulator of replication initiation timing